MGAAGVYTIVDARLKFGEGQEGYDNPPPRPRLQQSTRLVGISTGRPGAKRCRIKCSSPARGWTADLMGNLTDHGNPSTLSQIVLQLVSIVIFQTPGTSLLVVERARVFGER